MSSKKKNTGITKKTLIQLIDDLITLIERDGLPVTENSILNIRVRDGIEEVRIDEGSCTVKFHNGQYKLGLSLDNLSALKKELRSTPEFDKKTEPRMYTASSNFGSPKYVNMSKQYIPKAS